MKGLIFVFSIVALSSCGAKVGTVRTVTPTDFIVRDSANKMISSYLGSINSASNDTDLRSLLVNMDQIQLYNDSCSGTNQIKKLKIMFAHNLNYINLGHANQKAGYKSGALTIVIAGVNSDGNYVYFQNDAVIDNSSSCPYNCPQGSASNPLLTLQ